MRTRVIARRRPAVRPHRRARTLDHPRRAPRDAAPRRDDAAPRRRDAAPRRSDAAPRRGNAAPLALPSTPAVRKRTRHALVGATLLLAATTTPASAQTSTRDAATSVAVCAAAVAEPGSRSRATLRAALRCAVNAERSGHGLAGLRHDRRLARAAKRHARDMVRHRYFAHERPGWTLAGRLAAAGWSGARAAEAIAWGCGGRGSAHATLQAWLASPSHRAIVLGDYRRVGIGLAVGVPTADRCGTAGTWVLDVGA